MGTYSKHGVTIVTNRQITVPEDLYDYNFATSEPTVGSDGFPETSIVSGGTVTNYGIAAPEYTQSDSGTPLVIQWSGADPGFNDITIDLWFLPRSVPSGVTSVQAIVSHNANDYTINQTVSGSGGTYTLQDLPTISISPYNYENIQIASNTTGVEFSIAVIRYVLG